MAEEFLSDSSGSARPNSDAGEPERERTLVFDYRYSRGGDGRNPQVLRHRICSGR
ncbi:hypothetical protein [Microseira wollei]|uniref:Uncharacterized protein n=1 Tax=Microseira wollei NIES-4236 TaxID=2530354 RepID=A0AAV3XCZ4_9CYAN|nr:hypothetical protein [Microseira wollei]GET39256.1 hypothetical protein MiSe_40200 [Microseira wollei NIES-4236]